MENQHSNYMSPPDGLILAGGQSVRMGKDKALLTIAGATLVEHQIKNMLPRVQHLYIAANHMTDALRSRMPHFGEDKKLIWLEDHLDGAHGPLSGVTAALTKMQFSTARYLWVSSCDAYGVDKGVLPLLQKALLENDADIACLTVDGREQPLQALLDCHLGSDLKPWLEAGNRSVFRWYHRHKMVTVSLNDTHKGCYNINTPADYQSLLQTQTHCSDS
ncbi:Molybdenum cofactor guanylyltransferase [BD1-7 clade bacterium]|uniref:Molybdenum cofactor guanylyltransferase n=1 Tax=BD1-7 clade bacterium TaxID=2029982 RepID=A0A5S9PGI0_9GAMM|nr:Molybdenum cofactor guanylyltransferase [BD1-7 clade bacterium]CAA0102771.1 Molybdenum cofactor guanylyltransferase [BD1-7 clade bacterium]